MTLPIVSSESAILEGPSETRRFLSVVELSGKAKPIGKRPMVEVVTTLGFRATIGVETLFAIMHKDGLPVVCNPLTSVAPAIPDEWLAPIADFSSDPRSWYARGALVSAGEYRATRSRPARITIRANVNSRNAIVRISNYLTHARDTLGIRNFRAPVEVSHAEAAGHVTVWSRLLDVLAADVLIPNSVSLAPTLALHELPAEAQGCFLAGFMDGLPMVNGELLLAHRYAAVLRQLHHILFRTFSVPARLDIHPLEAGAHRRARVKNPHRLSIPPELPRWRTAEIATITPLEAEAFELDFDEPIFLDGLILHPRFEVDDAAVSLASSDFLFPPHLVSPDWLAEPQNFYTNEHGVL